MTPADAERIATRAHAGQKYGSEPYRVHLADVARRVAEDPDADEAAVVVAWLHDTLEDTELRASDLEGFGLSRRQLDAVMTLTKGEIEPYWHYIERVRKHPLARLVKQHDLESNLAADPPEDLRQRYEKALARIREARLGITRCRACQAPIVFLRTHRGKWMPVDRDSLPSTFDSDTLVFQPTLGHESHYATCPEAERFRRRR